MATPEATAAGAVAGKRIEVPIKKATGPGRRQGPHLAVPGAAEFLVRHRDRAAS